jgi:hypothetical protein
VPGEKSLHLTFIIGVQDVIERQAAFGEILLEAVPDGDDFRS